MRAYTALAICVSLAASSLAQGSTNLTPIQGDSAASQKSFSEWTTLYQSATAAGRQHRDQEAAILFEHCWTTAADDEERGLAANGLGEIDRRLGRISDAKEWLGRARQAFSSDPRLSFRLVIAVANLADLDRSTGDYSGAERVLRGMPESPRADATSLAFIRNNLADLLREEGKTEEAQQLFRETLNAHDIAAREQAGALIGLADIERQQAAWGSSIDQWNKVLDISRQEHDEAMETIALRGLGSTWLQSGSASRAEPLLRRALKLAESNPDMPPEEVADTHAALAELYRSENKLTLAQNQWSRALEIDRPLLGETHPQVAVLMEMLSDVYSARGEFSTALEYASKASEAMSCSFGENSMPVATALTNQAGVEQRANDFDDAARHYEQAIRIARLHPEHRPLQMTMMERYAALLKIMHRVGEAKALLAERNAWLARNFAVPVK